MGKIGHVHTTEGVLITKENLGNLTLDQLQWRFRKTWEKINTDIANGDANTLVDDLARANSYRQEIQERGQPAPAMPPV